MVTKHSPEHVEIDVSAISRFWDKTEKQANGCLLWTGFAQVVGKNPQPRFYLKGHTRSPRLIAWFIREHELPQKKFLRVTCRNPLCVAPAHLENVESIEEALSGPTYLPLAKGYDPRRRVHGL